MKLLKKKINKHLFEAITAVFLILCLTITMGSPQTARAESKGEMMVFSTSLSTLFSFESEPVVGFPESDDKEPKRVVTAITTAYNSLVGQTDSTPCITANGFDLCEFYEENGFGNTVAANFLALGTQVRFPDLYGDKVFVVRDRMNAKYNGTTRVDIWMNDYGEARIHGAKRLKMEIF
ncbi:3D domain-containing protein [Patescibacteria group bacterium]|nr:3D domain-containing protein [Patescibacteria group bacterium]MBU1895447.1 3D domain-containing protein [Patescibacteria group bacterium]